MLGLAAADVEEQDKAKAATVGNRERKRVIDWDYSKERQIPQIGKGGAGSSDAREALNPF